MVHPRGQTLRINTALFSDQIQKYIGLERGCRQYCYKILKTWKSTLGSWVKILYKSRPKGLTSYNLSIYEKSWYKRLQLWNGTSDSLISRLYFKASWKKCTKTWKCNQAKRNVSKSKPHEDLQKCGKIQIAYRRRRNMALTIFNMMIWYHSREKYEFSNFDVSWKIGTVAIIPIFQLIHRINNMLLGNI